MVNVARPCVVERRSVAYPNMVASGTRARIACALPRGSRPSTRPRRELRSDRKSTRLNSSHSSISYAVFCLKKKKKKKDEDNSEKKQLLTTMPHVNHDLATAAASVQHPHGNQQLALHPRPTAPA